jgi:AraC-like DNA-binding protein/quercetin dioxygenase-like cupin family protein
MTAPRQHPVEVSLPGYGVFVLESQHAPHFHMPAERHTFLEVFLVIRGSGVFELGGVEHPCADGDVVAVPPGTPHRIADRPGDPLGLYGVCVAPDVWRHDPELIRRLPAGRLPVRPGVADRVRTDLRRVLYEQTRAARASGTVILGVTLQLLAALVRASEADPPTPSVSREHRQAVERYLAELPDRFFEPTSLDQVAGELGMSRRRFTELFRELAGESWADRLARLRVRHACRLLADTSRSITAIAFEAGYEDLSGFYRAFKRLLGVPPDAYRKRSAGTPLPDPPIAIARSAKTAARPVR